VGRRSIWIPPKLELALEDVARRAGVSFSKAVVAHVVVAIHRVDVELLQLRGRP